MQIWWYHYDLYRTFFIPSTVGAHHLHVREPFRISNKHHILLTRFDSKGKVLFYTKYALCRTQIYKLSALSVRKDIAVFSLPHGTVPYPCLKEYWHLNGGWVISTAYLLNALPTGRYIYRCFLVPTQKSTGSESTFTRRWVSIRNSLPASRVWLRNVDLRSHKSGPIFSVGLNKHNKNSYMTCWRLWRTKSGRSFHPIWLRSKISRKNAQLTKSLPLPLKLNDLFQLIPDEDDDWRTSDRVIITETYTLDEAFICLRQTFTGPKGQ